MTKLSIWTAADTKTVSTVYSDILRSFRPDVPDHQFLSFDEEAPPPTPTVGGIMLVCGLKPLDKLRAAGFVPKNRTVGSMREKFILSPLGGHRQVAIALIDDAYPGGEIETVGVIHDALVAYVPDKDPLLWARRVVKIMSNLPFDQLGWKPQLKFTVDAEIGQNLATLKKVKLAS